MHQHQTLLDNIPQIDHDTNAELKISLYVCVHIKTIILTILELFALEVFKVLKKQTNFKHILLFLNVCKQTFDISHVRVSQNVKDVLTLNLQHIIFMWRQRY